MNITGSWLFIDYLPCFFYIDLNESKVALENIEDDNDGQLWKKGEPDKNGYFTLKNNRVPKFLTFVSSITVEGNITLRWILGCPRMFKQVN